MTLTKYLFVDEHACPSINRFEYNNEIKQIEGKLIVSRFFEKDQLIKYWENRIGSDIWDEGGKFLGLAYISNPYAASLVFSVREEDYGTIWIELEDFQRIKIADNFLVFLKSCQEKMNNESLFLKDLFPLNEHLYKKWDEDFWRIRENKEA